MSLPSWELLSYIVTVVALPFAIAVFLFEQRKERANEEEAIWQQISDAYIDFLEVVLANPDLRLRSQSATPNLSDEQRVQAMALSQALKALADAARQGGNLADLEAQAMAALRAKGWEPDYLSVRQRSDLQTPADARSGDLVALGAARLGSTRLIDNLEF